jgi:hypothetical protein
MAEDYSGWPTKQEARQQLGGVPERTFDRWLSEHDVKVFYRKVTGRRPVPVVDPAGVALLQRAMMTAAPTLSVPQESPGFPAVPQIPPQWREMAAAFLTQMSPPEKPLFITLEEAEAYSGLSPTLLKRLVNEGTVLGFPHDRGYKISRKSLDTFAEGPGIRHIEPVAGNGGKRP